MAIIAYLNQSPVQPWLRLAAPAPDWAISHGIYTGELTGADFEVAGYGLRGTGTGTRLVLACLAWFRDNTDYRIVPLCPFIPAVMRRFPEYNDLLNR